MTSDPRPDETPDQTPGRTVSGPPRVRLYGRDGCHLCDVAREVVARVCAEVGERFDEVSIDSDPDLLRRFGEEIPVTFVDGRQHDFWRVDEQRLRAALSR